MLFTDRADYEFFLDQLEASVNRKELIVESYALLSTHFHLLVTSPAGLLSKGMEAIQHRLARYVNRRRSTDGSRMRGRFLSKPVTTRLYESTVVRYIDFNPVQAGLAKEPSDYPWGSARHYVGSTEPAWLSGERLIDAPRGTREFADAYSEVYGLALGEDELDVLRRRARNEERSKDELDRLYDSPPTYLARWMAERARTVTGRPLWRSYASPRSIALAISHLKAIDRFRRPLLAGNLRALAACTLEEIGKHIGQHRSSAARALRHHGQLLETCEPYRELTGRVARRALDITYRRTGSPASA